MLGLRASLKYAIGGGSGIAMYVGGGSTTGSTQLASIRKLAYATQTWSTLAASLTKNRHNVGAPSNRGVASYMGWGTQGDSSGTATDIDKIDYGTDTGSIVTGSSHEGLRIASVENPGVEGHWAGETTGGSGVQIRTRKVNFATDVTSENNAGLPTALPDSGSTSNYPTAGYFCEFGSPGAGSYDVLKLAFATGVYSLLTTVPDTGRVHAGGALGNPTVAGYFQCINSNLDAQVKSLRRIDFATETITKLTGVVPSGQTQFPAGLGYDPGESGYIAGDGTSTGRTTRLAFATETTSLTAAIGDRYQGIGSSN